MSRCFNAVVVMEKNALTLKRRILKWLEMSNHDAWNLLSNGKAKKQTKLCVCGRGMKRGWGGIEYGKTLAK